MLRTLRIFFLGRLLREKLLLLAFVSLGMLWWLSSFTTHAGRFWREQRSTTAALKEQQQWLNNRGSIDAAVQKAAGRLVAANTLDGTRLATEVSSLASASGLRNAGGEPPTKNSNGQFSVHTLNYTIRNADFLALLKFYVALRDRSPYIGIDQFSLTANPANPAQLSLSLRVSSVEIAR
ncbi:MAG: hypothetical protein EXS38_05025 [Opitutus sp.]|nr:hypothetical protein [Opitutus sp.]